MCDARRLLAVFMVLPESLEKSAHMLMLKYLREFGWRSTVLTTQSREGDAGDMRPVEDEWCGVRVVRIQPRSLRWRWAETLRELRGQRLRQRLVRLPRWAQRGVTGAAGMLFRPLATVLGFPDQHASAVGDLVRAGMELHGQQGFDAVGSLYYPLSAHQAAAALAKQAGLPWLALTKDYYSWPDAMLPRLQRCGPNQLKRSLERRVLQSASLIAPVNENITDYLRVMLPAHAIETLPHCYDESDFGVPLPSAGAAQFRMVSVGLTAESEEPGLDFLFSAIGELVQQQGDTLSRFQLRFVGHGGDLVRRCARRNGCERYVEISPQLPHAEAMRELREASCLLFQQAPWGNRRRLPEYFAARKPILAFPRYPGIMSERLLQAYGAAVLVGERESLQQQVLAWYQRFHSAEGLKLQVNEAFVHQFSARSRGKELADLLSSVCTRQP